MTTKIEKKIAHWQQRGLIDATQAEKILDYERQSGKSRRTSVVLYGFVVLGGCVISIGVISLIAANWDGISSAVKLGIAFGVHLGLAAGIYWAQSRGRDILFDVLGTIFLFWCLATIGLVAQIFPAGGEPYQALTFWLIITLPLSYFGKRGVLASLWVLALFATFFTWTLDEKSWWATHFMLDESHSYVRDAALFPLFMISALWSLALASVCTHVRSLRHFATNLAFWGLAASMAAAVAGDIYWSTHEFSTGHEDVLLPAYALLALAAIVVGTRIDTTRREKIVLTLLLALSVLIYVPSRHGGSFVSDHDIAGAVGAIYSVLSMVLLAIYFALRQRYALFNAVTIAIGVRFLIVYFQVFEDLAYTGVGLVISGLVIIGLAVAWYKLRPRLERLVRGLVQ